MCRLQREVILRSASFAQEHQVPLELCTNPSRKCRISLYEEDHETFAASVQRWPIELSLNHLEVYIDQGEARTIFSFQIYRGRKTLDHPELSNWLPDSSLRKNGTIGIELVHDSVTRRHYRDSSDLPTPLRRSLHLFTFPLPIINDY